MEQEKILISIVDDHPLMIGGIEKLLSGYERFSVLGKYNHGAELLEGLKTHQPDILLLDIHMPGKDGEVLMGIIGKTYPEIKVIALTGQDTPYYIQSMMAKGCMGYLLKNLAEEEMVKAIETVYEGKEYLADSIREEVISNMLKNNNKGALIKEKLTNRETDILKLIVEEYTSQEIANRLFLSLKTVEKYRINLLQKLKVKNTAGLVKVALQQNLLNI